ncbi:LysR family transcriptional regulator [Streptomyces sp. NBC_00984]|uniref:helix-turn-helix domain-containing protein n=1 Tax=Streptomyces sp. NBC_00984 TaxID=2903700 RepID=UPI00386EF4D8
MEGGSGGGHAGYAEGFLERDDLHGGSRLPRSSCLGGGGARRIAAGTRTGRLRRHRPARRRPACASLGIRCRPPGRPKCLAGEAGEGGVVVDRHDDPLRPRGGASHQTALRTVDEAEALPTVLHKALISPYARQRLSRLLAARTYPTLTEAARDLGIHQSTLVIQINRLEADLGLPLFERAERHDGETK